MPWYKKFAILWKVTPSDLKLRLVAEFLLDPDSFESRFQEEEKFQRSLGMWED